MTYRVGDRGLFRPALNRYGKDTPAEVVKVGRKYMFVALAGYHRDAEHLWMKCDLATGAEVASFGYVGRFVTTEQQALEDRTQAAWDALKAIGLVKDSSWTASDCQLTVDQLESIVALITQPASLAPELSA